MTDYMLSGGFRKTSSILSARFIKRLPIFLSDNVVAKVFGTVYSSSQDCKTDNLAFCIHISEAKMIPISIYIH